MSDALSVQYHLTWSMIRFYVFFSNKLTQSFTAALSSLNINEHKAFFQTSRFIYDEVLTNIQDKQFQLIVYCFKCISSLQKNHELCKLTD